MLPTVLIPLDNFLKDVFMERVHSLFIFATPDTNVFEAANYSTNIRLVNKFMVVQNC